MKRTHTCGDLTGKDKGKQVCIQGWVSTRRDHGGVVFVDVRDRYGLTQAVFNPGLSNFNEAEHLRREDCIEVHGKVRHRPEGMMNPKMKTGEVEVVCEKLVMLNKAEVAPLEVDDTKVANDDMRLKYRYLDLRRPHMLGNLSLRHKAAMAAREFLSKEGFLEIETPLLVKPTPEGARDYVVPSRVNPGRFYSLPQSPQLYKQLLMASGVDKYFQFPRCLRDEDLRQDRQPEHTQIDVEFSFPELEDIYTLGESLIKNVLKKSINYNLKTPIPRISHEEAMDKYGCDKPDLRYGLELCDVTSVVSDSDFSVFKDVIGKGGIVKCINPPKDLSRKEVDAYIKYAQDNGAKGMAWVRVTKDGMESSIVKYFNDAVQKRVLKETQAKPGSMLFFIADNQKMTNQVLDKIRRKLADDLKLYNPKDFAACWIIDFPLFEWNEDEERWDAMHHLFCMPKEEHLKHLEDDPGKVYCTQYDFVLNGLELASGSIRIHRPEIQERVMKVIGLTQKDVQKKFGFLLEAFTYGAPPHGGFAFGFDRIVALLAGTTDIREVIAFPKNKNAECPMDGSPSEVESAQLKELHLKLDVVKGKK
jgi:aspartyl-tRNA synthetase